MGDTLRREVLQVFKKLHRTRLNVFKDDQYALAVVREKINGEYRKNKNETNPATIGEMNKLAQDVEHEIRTTVIQLVETDAKKYEMRLRSDVLLENKEYTGPTEKHFQRRKGGCCQQAPTPKDIK